SDLSISRLCSAKRSRHPVVQGHHRHPEEGPPVRKAAIALTAFLGGLLIVLCLGAGTASAQEDGEAVQGTLVSAGQPVAGVKIDVKAEGGAAVGSAVSDDTGKWRVGRSEEHTS